MTQKLLMFPLQNDLFRITLKGNVGFKTCTLFMMLNLTLSTLGKLTNQGNFRMFVKINKSFLFSVSYVMYAWPLDTQLFKR